jgi:hypothetical protein
MPSDAPRRPTGNDSGTPAANATAPTTAHTIAAISALIMAAFIIATEGSRNSPDAATL